MGALMFISFDDLLMDFAKDQDLSKWEIVIASHEIMGSLKTRGAIAGVSTGINYESKYDNIEFVNSLRPTASTMEYAYSTDKDRFIESYNSHLLSAEPFMDVCCIVDMIVNEDINVMIVMAGYECSARIPEYLREFIDDQFGVTGFLYSDLKRLSENFDNPTIYEKIIKSIHIEVPEEFNGRNFDCILSQSIVNIDVVKENLELQKTVAADMCADPGEEDNLKSIFFNRFTEDLESKLKSLLMKRSDDDIKDICRAKQIRIAPGASKQMLVDKILHNMRLNSVREVEYVED